MVVVGGGGGRATVGGGERWTSLLLLPLPCHTVSPPPPSQRLTLPSLSTTSPPVLALQSQPSSSRAVIGEPAVVLSHSPSLLSSSPLLHSSTLHPLSSLLSSTLLMFSPRSVSSMLFNAAAVLLRPQTFYYFFSLLRLTCILKNLKIKKKERERASRCSLIDSERLAKLFAGSDGTMPPLPPCLPPSPSCTHNYC